jgi:hypothetical protein
MPARNHPRVIPKAARRSPLVLAMAGLLAAAGGLHLAALPSHLESSALVGAFFAATALGQLLGAVLIATRPSPRTTAVVIAGNLAVLAIWAMSRTTGLPVGGEVGTPEPFGVLDGLAAAAQILVVAGGLRTILRGATVVPGRSAGWQPALVLGVAWLVAGGLGTGLVEARHDHHHADRTEDVWRAFLLEPAEPTNGLPAGDGHSDGDHRHAGRCAVSDPCGTDHHHSG